MSAKRRRYGGRTREQRDEDEQLDKPLPPLPPLPEPKPRKVSTIPPELRVI